MGVLGRRGGRERDRAPKADRAAGADSRRRGVGHCSRGRRKTGSRAALPSRTVCARAVVAPCFLSQAGEQRGSRVHTARVLADGCQLSFRDGSAKLSSHFC